MRSKATLDFLGAFQPDAFVGFVDHRARRLDLAARIEAAGSRLVRVTVEGEPDLIDAFEMACSLGPVDCLVHDVVRADSPGQGS